MTTRRIMRFCLGVAQQKTLWQRAMRYMNHKPGWCALYLFYCCIPIVLYVAYLLRRSKEPNADEVQFDCAY